MVLGDFGGAGAAKEETKLDQFIVKIDHFILPTKDLVQVFVMLITTFSCKDFEKYKLSEARKTSSLMKVLNNLLSNSAISKLKKWPKGTTPDDLCLKIL